MCRTRQAAGIGRPRLRFVVPPYLPETLTVQSASRLRSAAAGADVDLAWLETPLDAEFSAIGQRRADAGLGWLTPAGEAVPAGLEVMRLGDFEPVVWIPSAHPAAPGGVIGLTELTRMDIVHGPRRISAGIYDAWLEVLRASHPRLEFTDPPFRSSLPMTLAFAAASSRPTAVLTGPAARSGPGPRRPGRTGRPAPTTWSRSASRPIR